MSDGCDFKCEFRRLGTRVVWRGGREKENLLKAKKEEEGGFFVRSLEKR